MIAGAVNQANIAHLGTDLNIRGTAFNFEAFYDGDGISVGESVAYRVFDDRSSILASAEACATHS